MRPDQVLRPTSLAELSSALAQLHSPGEAAVPWGGGTRMQVGNLPERYTAAIDLSRLTGSIEHEAGDLTVFAEAGVTIGELEKTLARQGQRLPFDVPDPARATLGGSIASNAGGQMRSSLGGIRDWVIGMKVVLADGTVTKSGGRVVKNVQGYDLHRLHTGAFGTLGIIAEAGLKVVPIPASFSTVAAWFESVAAAGEYSMDVFNSPAMPEALTVFAGRSAGAGLTRLTDQSMDDGAALVLARVAGGAEAVARMEADLTGAAGTAGAAGYEIVRGKDADGLWTAVARGGSGDTLSVRATLKPRDAVKYLASVSRSAGTGKASGELQAGFGTVSVSYSEAGFETIEQVRRTAAKLKAQVVIERCPADLKKDIDVFGDLGQSLVVMKSVKQRFDPNRVLNPGRFAGHI